MEGVRVLRFLYEKEVRDFYCFLVLVCILQAGIMAVGGFLQIQGIRRTLVEHEKRAVSYLLEEDVSPEVAAAAWSHAEVTEEGENLLKQIGHTKESQGYLLVLVREASVPLIILSVSGAVLFTVVLLTGAGIFFQKREELYERAERIVSDYANGEFEEHLPGEKTGALYYLFGRVEQLALSLRAKSDAEGRAKDFLKNMISEISHQLKTPIAALEMYMEILAEEPSDAGTVKEFTRKSVQSLERMEQLIQSLLKIARLDTGNIVFEKRKDYVSELAAQAIGEFLERADQEGKQIITEGDPEEMVFCDLDWTREAVANLVKNALDHTDAGGIIRISWKRSPAMLRLTVEDNGCGIALKDIHHIFKRFYRSSSSKDRQGAGLGLPLAKAIIEEQGGTLSVDSRFGEGTAFQISFLNNL